MDVYGQVDLCLTSQRAVTRTLRELADQPDFPKGMRWRLSELSRISEESANTLDDVLTRLFDPTENLPIHVRECVQRLDGLQVRRLEDLLALGGLHVPSFFTADEVVAKTAAAVATLSPAQQDSLRPYLCPRPVFHVRDADVDQPPSERYYACWTVAIFPDAPSTLICSDFHPGQWAIYNDSEGALSLRNYGQWRDELGSILGDACPNWPKDG